MFEIKNTQKTWLFRNDLSKGAVVEAWAAGSLGFAYMKAGSDKPAKTAAYVTLNQHWRDVPEQGKYTKMKKVVL